MSKLKAEWIPAHLEQNGPAKVEQYFDSRVTQRENGYYVGFFRGHELIGSDLPVPEGYSANLVTIQDNKFLIAGELAQVRVWDLDLPSLELSKGYVDAIRVGDILCEE